MPIRRTAGFYHGWVTIHVEVELKARLAHPQAVRQRLRELTTGVVEVYQDTYFERPGGSFGADGCELRVRTVESAQGVRHLLTFKAPPVEVMSGSKPEYETAIGDAHMMADILTCLGFPAVLAFTKQCVNYRLILDGRDVLATVVTVPEIEGTFLELESMADPEEVVPVLDALRGALRDLDVGEEELTRETYADAVRAARLAG
jgi:adenylate cyclase, class 2